MENNKRLKISEELLCDVVKEEMLDIFSKDLKHIKLLVEQYPNDYDLGQSVREFFNKKKN